MWAKEEAKAVASPTISGGVPEIVAMGTVIGPTAATVAPSLTYPATNDTIGTSFDIEFAMREMPTAATVKMTFTENGTAVDANDPHVVTFNSNFESFGTHTTSLTATDLAGNANVASVDTDPNDLLASRPRAA